jgi:hypothetical protein
LPQAPGGMRYPGKPLAMFYNHAVAMLDPGAGCQVGFARISQP